MNIIVYKMKRSVSKWIFFREVATGNIGREAIGLHLYNSNLKDLAKSCLVEAFSELRLVVLDFL